MLCSTVVKLVFSQHLPVRGRGENALNHGTRKKPDQTAVKFAMAYNKIDNLYAFDTLI